MFSWFEAVVPMGYDENRDPPETYNGKDGGESEDDLEELGEKVRARSKQKQRSRNSRKESDKDKSPSHDKKSSSKKKRSPSPSTRRLEYREDNSYHDTTTYVDDTTASASASASRADTWEESLASLSVDDRNLYLKRKEQKEFEKCEDLYLPLILRWKKAIRDEDVMAVQELVSIILKEVNSFSSSFIESYGLPQLMKESRYLLEDDNASIGDYETLWRDMWYTYTAKARGVPADFKPSKRQRKQDMINAFVDSADIRPQKESRPRKDSLSNDEKEDKERSRESNASDSSSSVNVRRPQTLKKERGEQEPPAEEENHTHSSYSSSSYGVRKDSRKKISHEEVRETKNLRQYHTSHNQQGHRSSKYEKLDDETMRSDSATRFTDPYAANPYAAHRDFQRESESECSVRGWSNGTNISRYSNTSHERRVKSSFIVQPEEKTAKDGYINMKNSKQMDEIRKRASGHVKRQMSNRYDQPPQPTAPVPAPAPAPVSKEPKIEINFSSIDIRRKESKKKVEHDDEPDHHRVRQGRKEKPIDLGISVIHTRPEKEQTIKKRDDQRNSSDHRRTHTEDINKRDNIPTEINKRDNIPTEIKKRDSIPRHISSSPKHRDGRPRNEDGAKKDVVSNSQKLNSFSSPNHDAKQSKEATAKSKTPRHINSSHKIEEKYNEPSRPTSNAKSDESRPAPKAKKDEFKMQPGHTNQREERGGGDNDYVSSRSKQNSKRQEKEDAKSHPKDVQPPPQQKKDDMFNSAERDSRKSRPNNDRHPEIKSIQISKSSTSGSKHPKLSTKNRDQEEAQNDKQNTPVGRSKDSMQSNSWQAEGINIDKVSASPVQSKHSRKSTGQHSEDINKNMKAVSPSHSRHSLQPMFEQNAGTNNGVETNPSRRSRHSRGSVAQQVGIVKNDGRVDSPVSRRSMHSEKPLVSQHMTKDGRVDSPVSRRSMRSEKTPVSQHMAKDGRVDSPVSRRSMHSEKPHVCQDTVKDGRVDSPVSRRSMHSEKPPVSQHITKKDGIVDSPVSRRSMRSVKPSVSQLSKPKPTVEATKAEIQKCTTAEKATPVSDKEVADKDMCGVGYAPMENILQEEEKLVKNESDVKESKKETTAKAEEKIIVIDAESASLGEVERAKRETERVKRETERVKKDMDMVKRETEKAKKETASVKSKTSMSSKRVTETKSSMRSVERQTSKSDVVQSVVKGETAAIKLEAETKTGSDGVQQVIELPKKEVETTQLDTMEAVKRETEKAKREVEKAKKETEAAKIIIHRVKSEAEKSKTDKVEPPTQRVKEDLNIAKSNSKLSKQPEDLNVMSTATQPGYFSFYDDSLVGTVEFDPASLAVQQGENASYMDDTLETKGEEHVPSVYAVGGSLKPVKKHHTQIGGHLGFDNFSVLTMDQTTTGTEEGSVKANDSIQEKIAIYEEALNEMTELRARAEIQKQAGVESYRLEETKKQLGTALKKVMQLQEDLESCM